MFQYHKVEVSNAQFERNFGNSNSNSKDGSKINKENSKHFNESNNNSNNKKIMIVSQQTIIQILLPKNSYLFDLILFL